MQKTYINELDKIQQRKLLRELNKRAMENRERIDPRRYVRINSKSWSVQPSKPRATDTRTIRTAAVPSAAWFEGRGYASRRRHASV